MSKHELFENKSEHSSYGTVRFSRQECGGQRRKLFGSSLRHHLTTISLVIKEATRYHSLSEDRIYGNKDIIRIELSAAQFAELLTTMNVGSGVSCTIRYREGKRIENPPDDEIEIDRVQTSFRSSMGELVKWIKERQSKLSKILGKNSIGKKDREFIQGTITNVLQEVEANWPFVVDQFSEATERVVTAAKSEIDSFVTGMVNRTGLKQLQTIAQNVNLIEEGDQNG